MKAIKYTDRRGLNFVGFQKTFDEDAHLIANSVMNQVL